MSNEQKVTNKKWRAKSNEQRAESNKQRATSKKFNLERFEVVEQFCKIQIWKKENLEWKPESFAILIIKKIFQNLSWIIGND